MANTDPTLFKAGSSSLVMGCDSYTSPAELGETELIMAQNCTVRGGICQTRPGSASLLCQPDGNNQGFITFTPDNGVAHHVFVIDGLVYVSAAPFKSYRRLTNLKFSPSAKYIAWAVCLKSTDYDNEGVLFSLENPYSVLIMQDGLTRAAYWDGGNSGHINPASPDFPDNTDNIPGFNGTPIGLWMIWSGNRLWVSRGNQIYAGDIGNPLKFTETLYLNEARAFYLSGPCTGMIEIPSDNAGAKGFIAFTANNGTSFQSYIQDRTLWLSTPLFQNTILPNIGNVAPRSLITQYGLNWWFGPRGLTNINSALRQNITSRIDYQDNEMFSSKAYLGPDLSMIAGCFYENYLMMSVPSGDVRNRHTWVLDQAPFNNNAPAWPGIWTGWRPVEWSRAIINGSERVFFSSVDYDGKNRIWEAMLPERRDNGCAITCYAQLRDHAAGNLDLKQYDWSKFFLSQIYGDVDLSVYVASTKGGYQLQKTMHLAANEGQIFSDTEYSEAGPFMVGNRPQSRIIRTPSNPVDNECNACGVESNEGNMIDYAFSHLIVWSGQMGIKAYQLHMREAPERQDGDCEEDEVGPRTLNESGCSGLSLFVDGQILQKYEVTAEGATQTSAAQNVYIRYTAVSYISMVNARTLAECGVQSTINRLMGMVIKGGVYGTEEAVVGQRSYIIVDAIPERNIPVPIVAMNCVSHFGTAALCGISEYTTPSVPPKKYRNQALGGGWCNRDHNTADCLSGYSQQDRESYSGNFIYSASDCSQVNGQVSSYGLTASATLLPCSQPPFTSFGTPAENFAPGYLLPGRYTLTTTPTSKSWTWDGICVLGRDSSGTVTCDLSVEDTETDAQARAALTTGSLCVALRTARGAGNFSFDFRYVDSTLLCTALAVGITYKVTVDLVGADIGGGSPVVTTQTVFFDATDITQSIVINVPVPAAGKQTTIQNPQISVA